MTESKVHLKTKTENYRQLSLDLKQARDNLSTKRAESRQAGEKLSIAESDYRKAQYPQPRASHTERLREDVKRVSVADIDAIRTQAKNAHEAFNQATAEVKKLESSLSLTSPGLSIARKGFAIDEATNILNKAISQAGLLETLQQSLTMLRAGVDQETMCKDELRKLFYNTFFDALLINDTIPTYADSLKAIDERFN